MKYLLPLLLLLAACERTSNPYHECWMAAKDNAGRFACDEKYPDRYATPDDVTVSLLETYHMDNFFFQNDALNILAWGGSLLFVWLLPLLVTHLFILYLVGGDRTRYKEYSGVFFGVSIWPFVVGLLPVWGPIWLLAEGWTRLERFVSEKGKQRQIPRAIARDAQE